MSDLEKEITKTIDETGVKDTVVPLNREQRRKKERSEQNRAEAVKKQLNMPATKREIGQLTLYVKTLSERLFHTDNLNNALERLLIKKGFTTRDEVDEYFKFELERSHVFNTIQRSVDMTYDQVFELCEKHEIDPNVTILQKRINADSNLTEEEKKALIEKYKLIIDDKQGDITNNG